MKKTTKAFVKTLERKWKRSAGGLNLHLTLDIYGDVQVFVLAPDRVSLAVADGAALLAIAAPIVERSMCLSNMRNRFRLSALSADFAGNHVAAYRQYAGGVLEYAAKNSHEQD